MNWLRRYLPWLFVLVTIITPQVANAKTVTLSWDPSPTQEVIGYQVYMSLSSDMTQAQEVTATAGLTATIPDLNDGDVNYFAVTAHDAVGHESAFSNIVKSEAIPEAVLPRLDFEINVEVLK